MTPFKKNKKEIVRPIIRRIRFFHVLMAAACVFAGYVVVAGTDSTQKVYREIKGIEQVIDAADGAEDLDGLKQKVKNNPWILEKIGPTMLEKIKSNPLFQKKASSPR